MFKVLVVITICCTVMITGCIIGEADDANDQDNNDSTKGSPNRVDNQYLVGDSVGDFPRGEFCTVVKRWRIVRLPDANRATAKFLVNIEYLGKTESAESTGYYFGKVRDSLCIADGEYEFDKGIGEPSGELASLLPRESTQGWVSFEVPAWFVPTHLLAKQNSKILWRLRLETPDVVYLEESFDDLSGWSDHTGNDYRAGLDYPSGDYTNNGSAAHIFGDGYTVKPYISRVIDIRGWSGTMWLEFNFRARSDSKGSVTNAKVDLVDPSTSETWTMLLVDGGTYDTGWQHKKIDVSDILADLDEVELRLRTSDAWTADHDQEVWFDNVKLHTKWN